MNSVVFTSLTQFSLIRYLRIEENALGTETK